MKSIRFILDRLPKEDSGGYHYCCELLTQHTDKGWLHMGIFLTIREGLLVSQLEHFHPGYVMEEQEPQMELVEGKRICNLVIEADAEQGSIIEMLCGLLPKDGSGCEKEETPKMMQALRRLMELCLNHIEDNSLPIRKHLLDFVTTGRSMTGRDAIENFDRLCGTN